MLKLLTALFSATIYACYQSNNKKSFSTFVRGNGRVRKNVIGILSLVFEYVNFVTFYFGYKA